MPSSDMCILPPPLTSPTHSTPMKRHTDINRPYSIKTDFRNHNSTTKLPHNLNGVAYEEPGIPTRGPAYKARKKLNVPYRYFREVANQILMANSKTKKLFPESQSMEKVPHKKADGTPLLYAKTH